MADGWRDFVAGSVGGMVGVLVGHPADTVKVLQQTLGTPMLSVVRSRLASPQGCWSFFRGMSFPLVSAGAMNALYFGGYAWMLRQLGQSACAPEPSLGNTLVAGCVGGTLQLVVATPVDLVKIQLQTMWDAGGPLARLRRLYAGRGLRGCYHGLWATALRDVGSFGPYALLYEMCQRRLAAMTSDGQRTATATMLSGGLAGTLAWLVVLPVDVLKSRIQADDPMRPRYRGLLHCAGITLRTAGPTALYSGATMICLRAFITNAFTFLGYEYSLTALRKLDANYDI